MIESVEKGIRSPKARIICDDCGTTEIVTNDYERVGRNNSWKPNEGQAIRKAQGMGWEYVKGKLRCQPCAAKRHHKPKEAPVAENVTAIRQPTREQRRQIMDLMGVAYDTGAGRYMAGNTDQTIAEEIGGGVMPGWVAEIREQFFGADGGNDDMATLAADLAAWQADMEAKAKAMHDMISAATADLRAFNEGRGRAAEFLARIEKIKAAVGPKARSA